MNDENVKLIRNLDKLLFEETGESASDVRKRLESEGVNVAEIVARVKDAAAQAYRNELKEEAANEQSRRRQARGRIFGNLAELTKDKLLELIRRAESGDFGEPAMARCRNQKANNMSESDLRSLLEDIEATIKE